MHHGSLAAVEFTFLPGVVSQESSFYMWELPIFALIATLGGLLGAGFVGVSKRLALFRARHLAGARRRFAEASSFEEACYVWRGLENGHSGDGQLLRTRYQPYHNCPL